MLLALCGGPDGSLLHLIQILEEEVEQNENPEEKHGYWRGKGVRD
jgi:hypothetical protein